MTEKKYNKRYKNHVILEGHISTEPNMQYIGDNGIALLKFSIMQNSYHGGESVPMGYEVQIWGDKAEEANTSECPIGSHVEICGQWKVKKWQDKEGNNRYTNYLEVSRFGYVVITKKRDSE